MARRIKISGWNWADTEKGLQRELLGPNVKGRIRTSIIKTLVDAQKSFLDSLPSSEASYMPFITGNLHDSIASVISENGRVINASYTDPVAITQSEITGKDIFVRSGSFPTRVKGLHIIGSREAIKAVRNLQGTFPSKIAATMLIGVPYAGTPQEKGRHAGYIDVLASKYARRMEGSFRAAQALGMWRWKGGYNLPQKYIDAIIKSSE